MPGKPFLYNREIISSASRQQQQTINTYLSNKYKIDIATVCENYQSDKEVTSKPEYVQFKQLFDDSIKDTIWDLYLHLVLGKKEAALPLSECLRKGYGTNKDDFLADLTLAIGVILLNQYIIVYLRLLKKCQL